MTKLTKAMLASLQVIVTATRSEIGYAFNTEKSVKPLVDAGFVEINVEVTEGEKVAVRATEAGTAHIDEVNGMGDEATADDDADGGAPTTFAIDTGVPIPTIKRRGAKVSVYPFDALKVGQSFFIPASDALPNPGKSLASTVSSASKRYATVDGTRTIKRREKLTNEDGSPRMGEDGKQMTGELVDVEVDNYVYERKFIVRSVEEDGVKGARVWRVDPTNDEDDENED